MSFFSINPEQAIALLKLLHVDDNTAAVADQATTVEPDEIKAGEQYAARRPRLNFAEMGIPIGSVLNFTQGDISVVVTMPKKVRLGDDEMSLTAATRDSLGLDYNVNPTPYWTFNGRLLKDLYNETYSES